MLSRNFLSLLQSGKVKSRISEKVVTKIANCKRLISCTVSNKNNSFSNQLQNLFEKMFYCFHSDNFLNIWSCFGNVGMIKQKFCTFKDKFLGWILCLNETFIWGWISLFLPFSLFCHISNFYSYKLLQLFCLMKRQKQNQSNLQFQFIDLQLEPKKCCYRSVKKSLCCFHY